MADSVACLAEGRVVLFQQAREPLELRSAQAKGRVVGLTRGRRRGEVQYAVRIDDRSKIVRQGPDESAGQRVFQSAETRLFELDFSFADEAFACAVESTSGTSALGILADDGRGLRTVTEGDVLDREPRWVPGGVGQIVYSSAGIGRSKSGARAGRAPFSLHRLRLDDSTVEVLMSDAKYDYVGPVAVSESVLYAIRRAYRSGPPEVTLFGALADAFILPFSYLYAHVRRLGPAGGHDRVTRQPAGSMPGHAGHDTDTSELVRITPNGTEVLAQGVRTFDVALNGELFYANDRAIVRMGSAKGSQANTLAELEHVEQLVIC